MHWVFEVLFTQIALIGTTFISAISLSKSGRKSEIPGFLVAMSVFILSLFWDSISFYFLEKPVLISHFGFLAFVVFTSGRHIIFYNNANNKLKLSEQKFRDFTYSVTDLFFALDENLNYISWNKACEELLGVNADAVIGKSWYDFEFNKNYSWIADKYAEVIAKKKPEHFEVSFRSEENTLYFIVNAYPTSSGLVVYLQDITNNKIVENKLNEEIAFTDKVLDAQSDTFFLFEPDTGKVLRWNKSFRDISGYTDAEIASLPAPVSYYSEQDLKRAAVFIEQLFRDEVGTIEMELICKDGRKVPTEYRASIIKDEQGKPKYLISIGRDISKRKAMEKELHTTQMHYTDFINVSTDYIGYWKMPDGLYVDLPAKEQIEMIEQSVCIDANKSLSNFYGFNNKKELVGKKYIDLVKNYDKDTVRELIKSNYRLIDEVYNETLKDGTKCYRIENWYGVINEGKLTYLWISSKDITEQVQAEKAVTLSEEKYKNLTNNLPDIVMMVDRKYNITYANRTLVGLTPEQVLGKNIIEFNTEQAQKDVAREHLEKVFKTGQSIDFEKEFITSGRTHHLKIRLCPLITEKKIENVIYIITDITEQYIAKEALAKSEEKFKEFAHGVTDLFFALDKDLNYIFWNNACEKFLGIPSDLILGKSWSDFEFNKGYEWIADKYKNVIKYSKPDHFEVNFGDKIKPMTFFVNVYPCSLGVLVYLQNVTPLKIAKKDLEHKNKLLRSSIENMPAGYILWDKDYKAVEWNKAAEKIFGFTKEEILGKNPVDYIVPEKDRTIVKNVLQSLKKGVSDSYTAKDNNVHKTGRLLSCQWFNTPLEDEDGNVYAIQSIALDITERIKHEEIKAAHYRLIDYAKEHSVNELLVKFLDELKVLTGSQVGFFYFYNEVKQTVSLKAWSTNTPEHTCEINESELELQISKAGMLMECIKVKKPIVHNDCNTLPNMMERTKGKASILRGLIVPVIYENKIKAIFCLGNKKTTYNNFDVRTAQQFAELAWETLERKRVNVELKESENRYKTFSDMNKEGIVLHDMGLVIEVNRAFCDIFGYSESELIGADPVEILFTNSSAEIIRKKHAEKYNKPYFVDGVKKDGEIVHLEVEGHNILYKNKNVRLSRVRDITELKKAQKNLEQRNKELLESENRYKLLTNSSKEGIAIHKKGIIINTNKAFLKIFGYNENEIVGQNFIPLLFPEKSMEIITGKIKKQDVNPYIVEAIRKDKSNIWVEIEARNFLYENSKVRLILVRDITERKQKDDIIRDSQKRFKLLTDLSMEGIVIHKDGIVQEVNPALEKILCENRENLIGINIIQKFAAENSKTKIEYYMRQELSGPYEVEIVNAEGNKLTLEIISYFLSKKDNLRVAVVRDISIQKETDKRIMNAIIEAEEKERNYFSKELHDGLGPILSSLNMYFEWLSNTNNKKEKEVILTNGFLNIKEAINTVEEISNKLTPRTLNTFGLSAAVESFIGKLRNTDSVNISFETNFDKRLTLNLEAAIYRVITELINNTIKHAKAAEAHVEISYSTSNNDLNVNYTDNGIGFDYDEKIQDQSRYGLVNILERIKTFNGSINFNTSPGKGLKVQIEFKNIKVLEIEMINS